jgi:hypothetical protein
MRELHGFAPEPEVRDWPEGLELLSGGAFGSGPKARHPARPLSTGRCPWVASHEGGEAFPVVSTGS